MKRCMLIVNPTAGRERAKYHKDNLRRQLETMFDEVELRETQKAGDATEWAKEAALTGFDSVFSMGGDGTLNQSTAWLRPRTTARSISASSPWVRSTTWPGP